MPSMAGITPAHVILDEVAHFVETGKLQEATAGFRRLGVSSEIAEAELKAFRWYLNNVEYPRPSQVMTLAERFNPKE